MHVYREGMCVCTEEDLCVGVLRESGCMCVERKNGGMFMWREKGAVYVCRERECICIGSMYIILSKQVSELNACWEVERECDWRVGLCLKGVVCYCWNIFAGEPDGVGVL